MRPTAVDAVILDKGRILLVKRRYPPFKNYWAIPGGFVEKNENVEQAIVREAYEETGIRIKVLCLLGVYSNPSRDPTRGTIAVAFLVKPISRKIIEGSEAEEVKWFKLDRLPKLAFDHGKIIKDVRKVLR